MKDFLKNSLIVLIGVPLAFIAYLVYVYVIDAYLTFVYALICVPLLLAILWWAFVFLKDFIISIFKENNEVDEKGFKKHF